jgi:hypothetical protein
MTKRTFHLRVAAEDQFFEGLAATITMKLKNGHTSSRNSQLLSAQTAGGIKTRRWLTAWPCSLFSAEGFKREPASRGKEKGTVSRAIYKLILFPTFGNNHRQNFWLGSFSGEGDQE